MKIFALADLHLSFSVPDKNMSQFGPTWKSYEEKLQSNWIKNISEEDIVLIPGDISWAMKLEDAIIDLEWIDKLPGTKVMIKGNHDYWWPSATKLRTILPESIHVVQNSVFQKGDVAITGTRLWDSLEYSFKDFIDYVPNPKEKKTIYSPEANEKVFQRELIRLENNLKEFPTSAKKRIVLTHYPPIGADLKNTKASILFEKYQVNQVVFGHLHNLKKGAKLFGNARGIEYHLVSCDYLDFMPKRI